MHIQIIKSKNSLKIDSRHSIDPNSEITLIAQRSIASTAKELYLKLDHLSFQLIPILVY